MGLDMNLRYRFRIPLVSGVKAGVMLELDFLRNSIERLVNSGHNENVSVRLDIANTSEPVLICTIPMVYWRKANQVHGWLDRRLGGVGNLEAAPVSKEVLQALLQDVERVLESRNSTEARRIMPPVEGPLFGDLSIGWTYYDDLEYTKTQLQWFLSEKKAYGPFYNQETGAEEFFSFFELMRYFAEEFFPDCGCTKVEHGIFYVPYW